ncbi:hypothetical protein GF389_04660 [Candidatus Dojkabacteria bacterium]|nr:hypothetical protein [Candidatus Dojkabacteria bacterium]
MLFYQKYFRNSPMHPRIKGYIEKQHSDRQEILKELRQIFIDTLSDFEEDFLWGVIAFNKGKFYLASLKKQVNVGFSIIGLSEEGIANFEGGGKTARHIKVNSLEELDRKNLIRLIKLVDTKAGIPK